MPVRTTSHAEHTTLVLNSNVTGNLKVEGNVVPSADNTADLGTSTVAFKDVHCYSGYAQDLTVQGASTGTNPELITMLNSDGTKEVKLGVDTNGNLESSKGAVIPVNLKLKGANVGDNVGLLTLTNSDETKSGSVGLVSDRINIARAVTIQQDTSDASNDNILILETKDPGWCFARIKGANQQFDFGIDIAENVIFRCTLADHFFVFQQKIQCDDEIVVTNNVTANDYVTTSDDRLKHNEVPIEDALGTVMKLSPQNYDKTTEFKEEDYKGELKEGSYNKESGLIAQEVNAIDELKHLVVQGDAEKPWKLNYGGLFVYNIKATQELNNKVVQQEERIKELEDRQDALLARIEALEAKQ